MSFSKQHYCVLQEQSSVIVENDVVVTTTVDGTSTSCADNVPVVFAETKEVLKSLYLVPATRTCTSLLLHMAFSFVFVLNDGSPNMNTLQVEMEYLLWTDSL